jgi:hypothetical protein
VIDLFGAATVFLLAFMGLIGVALLIFFLWLAYRYDINFTIHTKGKEKVANPESDPTLGTSKHESIP